MKEYKVKMRRQPLFWIVQADNVEEAAEKGIEVMTEAMDSEYVSNDFMDIQKVLTDLPQGWEIEQDALMRHRLPKGYVFIFNGKPYCSGREDRIMRIK